MAARISDKRNGVSIERSTRPEWWDEGRGAAAVDERPERVGARLGPEPGPRPRDVERSKARARDVTCTSDLCQTAGGFADDHLGKGGHCVNGAAAVDRLLRHPFVAWFVTHYKVVTATLVGAAPVVGLLLTLVTTWWIVLALLGAQSLIAVSTWLLGEGRVKSVDDERDDARADTLLGLTDGLEPVSSDLARMSTLDAKGRQQEKAGLLFSVLHAATVLGAEGSRTRACYFKFAEDGPRRMLHKQSIGRSVEAKAEFRAGTVAGDAALAMVDAAETLFCDDVDEAPPPGWEPSQRGEYKTFISVAVRAGDRAFGMLTIDAVFPGALTVEDVRMMRALGNLLGVVEQITA